MTAWLTYLRERFPLAIYLPLVGGFAASGSLLQHDRITALAVAVSFVGLMLFFAVLRLMDERKDFEKDNIAHPGRPLPRGLLTVTGVEQAIAIAALSMLLWALITALLTNKMAGLCYLVVTLYLQLLYREFYCAAWLEARPLLYALTHQLILIPLAYFSVFVISEQFLTRALTLNFSLLLIGAFFAYEVCRKLDPRAHPVLKTYLLVYGRAGTFAIVMTALLVAGWGAWHLDLANVLWPIEIALPLSMGVIWLYPAAYKIPQGVAGLCLLAHLWVIPVKALGSNL